jgi:ketosteroid isomerase-like protein
MTITPAPTTFDADALRRAFETRDAAALGALFADDAELELVDAVHGPSDPTRISGRAGLDAHVADLLERDMTHAVEGVVCDGERLGYAVRCAYPDGTRVLCVATATVRDGRIVRQTAVQAWDAA